MEMEAASPPCARSQTAYREGGVMRSTRIRLAATAALAALASPRRRKALFILAVAGLLAIVAGCSGGGDAAKNDSLEPSQDVFARAGGWIAFRRRLEDRGRRPGKPEGHPRARALARRRPHRMVVGWDEAPPSLDEPSLYGGLFVVHPDGSRTTVLPRSRPLRPREVATPTWGSFSPDGTEVAYGLTGGSRGPYIIDAEEGSLARSAVGAHARIRESCSNSAVNRSSRRRRGPRMVRDRVVRLRRRQRHVRPPRICPLLRQPGRHRPARRGRPPARRRWIQPRLVARRLAACLLVRDGSPGQIFVINADGSGLRQVTREGDNRWPTWSPDGSRIAFVHNGTLSTIAPDGTDMQSLNGVTPDGSIAWNPAG